LSDGFKVSPFLSLWREPKSENREYPPTEHQTHPLSVSYYCKRYHAWLGPVGGEPDISDGHRRWKRGGRQQSREQGTKVIYAVSRLVHSGKEPRSGTLTAGSVSGGNGNTGGCRAGNTAAPTGTEWAHMRGFEQSEVGMTDIKFPSQVFVSVHRRSSILNHKP
jgi:hypothetical protein